MSSTPTQLLVRKKITAIYADGSSKMNLGIATVVRMLKGATNVPVEVAANAAARELLAELARSAGRTVERASAGIFLTPPVDQPGVDQRAVPAAPAVSAGPKPRRTRGNGKVKPRAVRKYPTLSTTFLQGSLIGQIKAVFKSRETNPQKVTGFKLALANGTAPGIGYLCPRPSSPNCKPSVSRSRRQRTNSRGRLWAAPSFQSEFFKRNCQMKLLTTEITRMLLANGAKRDQDHAPVVTFFNPCGSATWLISETDPDEPDLLFGLCDLGMQCPELGSGSL